ncbi:MAG: hypothetical protein PVG24_09340 [Gammaproteobacteria bacterium]|jgi:hypothetical protein
MASRIDNGIQPTAHTAVQAMIVRAQQVADESGKAVGVHYDLATDQVSLVEITPDVPKDATFLRVAAPVDGIPAAAPETAGDGVEGKTREIKAASA